MYEFDSRSVVGVFSDHLLAQRAVNELKRLGFTDDQIGVAGRDSGDQHLGPPTADSFAAEGAGAGAVAGAGVGALWGLGIISGVLSPLGPAIAGGALAAILSSAAAGAAAASVAGLLVGMGVSKDDAEYYEVEFRAGRILVTVTAPGRESQARAVLRSFGGYDSSQRHFRSSDQPAATSASEGYNAPATPPLDGCTRTLHSAGHTPASSHIHTGASAVPFGRTELEVPVTKEDVQADDVQAEGRLLSERRRLFEAD